MMSANNNMKNAGLGFDLPNKKSEFEAKAEGLLACAPVVCG